MFLFYPVDMVKTDSLVSLPWIINNTGTISKSIFQNKTIFSVLVQLLAINEESIGKLYKIFKLELKLKE